MPLTQVCRVCVSALHFLCNFSLIRFSEIWRAECVVAERLELVNSKCRNQKHFFDVACDVAYMSVRSRILFLNFDDTETRAQAVKLK